MRFAPSIDIITALAEAGADLHLYDPQAMEEARSFIKKNVSFHTSLNDALKGCDCACFLTEWAEFLKIDFKKIKKTMRYPLIADGRNMFEKEKLTNLGFKYIGVGR
jgi:UDPglucose 6-dehydrogenase